MPRRNAARRVQAEEHVARNLHLLRTGKGWSYVALSRRLAQVGCPMNHTAIFKIEKGSPRRRISVDELAAFSIVFDRSLDDLVADPVLRSNTELVAKINEWRTLVAAQRDVMEDLEQKREYFEDRIVELAVMAGKTPRTVKVYVAGLGSNDALTRDLGKRLERMMQGGAHGEHREKT